MKSLNFLMVSKNLSLNWNYGSLLGMIFLIQSLSGMMMFLGYSSENLSSFSSIMFIMMENYYGWFLRLIHLNFVSLFFIIIFFHMMKGLFLNSYKMKSTWTIGFSILMILMLESFIGYVLIWSQMSYWACIVICSFLSIIPKYGFIIMFWLWSGYWSSSFTLKFFMMLHFFIPFIMIIMIIFHFMSLHKYKSSSKIINKNSMITFYPFFWIKDLYNVFIIMIFFILILLNSFYFNDTEMFMEKDELNSPIHIVPEWYFLFLYCILRSIPNKILGVFMFIISIFLFLILILISNKNFNFFNKIMIFKLIMIMIMLSWLGNCFVEIPYSSMGLLMTLLYMKMFLLIFMMNLLMF